jgi:dermatan 4-sulfotransferase 1
MIDRLYKKSQEWFKYFHPMLRGISKSVPIDWVLNRSMLSNSKKYCYFRIPKCANSTIVRTFAYYDSDLTLDEADTKGALIKRTARGSLLKAKTKNIDTLSSEYFCFTFVRCPYARTLSAYLDKIVAQGTTSKFSAVCREIQILSGSSEVTFENFVTYLENGGLYSDPHWCPQLAMLPLPSSKLAFVGRVENLDADLEIAVNSIFGEGTYRELATRETNRQDAASKLTEYYTDLLAERIYFLYEDDFRTFGYTKLNSRPISDA